MGNQESSQFPYKPQEEDPSLARLTAGLWRLSHGVQKVCPLGVFHCGWGAEATSHRFVFDAVGCSDVLCFFSSLVLRLG